MWLEVYCETREPEVQVFPLKQSDSVLNMLSSMPFLWTLCCECYFRLLSGWL